MIFGDMNVYTACWMMMVPSRATKAIHGLTNTPTSAAKRSAEPRAHDGDDVQNAGDNAECGVIGDAGDGEQHAACSTDDAALDERSLDIAAHDARERDVQHIHGLTTGRARQSHGLATERRKLDENPKRYDQGESRLLSPCSPRRRRWRPRPWRSGVPHRTPPNP